MAQEGGSVRAVGFGMGGLMGRIKESSGALSLAVELSMNNWRKRSEAELMVKDVKFTPLEVSTIEG